MCTYLPSLKLAVLENLAAPVLRRQLLLVCQNGLNKLSVSTNKQTHDHDLTTTILYIDQENSYILRNKIISFY